MKESAHVAFYSGSKEERLPGFAPDFPYIASRAVFRGSSFRVVPWHWHPAVELFYIESGTLVYETPSGVWSFPAGTGGLVNSNVLHTTKPADRRENVTQFLHIFLPSLIAGEPGGRIEKKYVAPFVETSGIDLLSIRPETAENTRLLSLLRASFSVEETSFGYELEIRRPLSDLWLSLLCAPCPAQKRKPAEQLGSAKIKSMLTYIREHTAEKINMADLAGNAFLSERECFRIFELYLHTTPGACIKSCRLQLACGKLVGSDLPITEVAQSCGLGSSSYFGKLFHAAYGCTPLQYRQRWRGRPL